MFSAVLEMLMLLKHINTYWMYFQWMSFLLNKIYIIITINIITVVVKFITINAIAIIVTIITIGFALMVTLLFYRSAICDTCWPAMNVWRWLLAVSAMTLTTGAPTTPSSKSRSLFNLTKQQYQIVKELFDTSYGDVTLKTKTKEHIIYSWQLLRAELFLN